MHFQQLWLLANFVGIQIASKSPGIWWPLIKLVPSKIAFPEKVLSYEVLLNQQRCLVKKFLFSHEECEACYNLSNVLRHDQM